MVSVRGCQSKGGGSKPRQKRKTFRDFCSPFVPSELSCKWIPYMVSGKIRRRGRGPNLICRHRMPPSYATLACNPHMPPLYTVYATVICHTHVPPSYANLICHPHMTSPYATLVWRHRMPPSYANLMPPSFDVIVCHPCMQPLYTYGPRKATYSHVCRTVVCSVALWVSKPTTACLSLPTDSVLRSFTIRSCIGLHLIQSYQVQLIIIFINFYQK